MKVKENHQKDIFLKIRGRSSLGSTREFSIYTFVTVVVVCCFHIIYAAASARVIVVVVVRAYPIFIHYFLNN